MRASVTAEKASLDMNTMTPLHDRILVKPIEEDKASFPAGIVINRTPMHTVPTGSFLIQSSPLVEDCGWHPFAKGPAQGQFRCPFRDGGFDHVVWTGLMGFVSLNPASM